MKIKNGYRICSALVAVFVLLSSFSGACYAIAADGAAVNGDAAKSSGTARDSVAEADIWDGSVAKDYSGGYGTKLAPYIIETPEQFALLASKCSAGGADTVGRYYRLANDIYLNNISDYNWKETAKPWTYGLSGAFKGHLDGNGYAVKGIYIKENSPEKKEMFAGMFSTLNAGATIQDFGIEYSHFEVTNASAQYFVGSFAGHVGNAEGDNALIRCYVDETVTVLGDFVGGLLGGTQQNISFLIDSCYATADIRRNSWQKGRLGGIVGDAWGPVGNRLIQNCYYASGQQMQPTDNCVDSWKYKNVYGFGQSDGNIYVSSKVLMYGDSAKESMPKLDYENVWETVKGQTPRLRKPVDAAESLDSQIKDKPYYRAAKLLSSLNIMYPRSERDYGEDDEMTRAETCAIICKFLGMKDSDIAALTADYKDVDKDYWAFPYIAAATSLKIVGGDGNGNFNPEAKVTANEAIKMIVGALGYERYAAAEGGYPIGYRTAAGSLGILKKVTFSDGLDTPILRKQLATVLYNALDVEVSEKADDITASKKTALEGYHGVYKDKGTVVTSQRSTITNQVKNPGKIMIDDTEYKSKLDFTPYLGLPCDFYYKEDNHGDEKEVIVFFPNEGRVKRTEVDFDDISGIRGAGNNITVEYYNEKDSKKEITLENPIVMYNDYRESFADTAAAADFIKNNMNNGTAVLLTNDGKDSKDIIFVNNYKAYVVSKVNVTDKKIYYRIFAAKPTEGGMLDFSDLDAEDEILLFDEAGEKIGFEDLKQNDVIMVYSSADGGKHTVIQSQRQLNGAIDSRKMIKAAEKKEIINPVTVPVSTIDFSNLNIVMAHPWAFDVKGNSLIQNTPYRMWLSTTAEMEKSEMLDPQTLNDSDYGGIKGKMDPNAGGPTAFGGKLVHLRSRYIDKNAYRLYITENLYDLEKLQVGETYKVSAWIYLSNPTEHSSGRATPGEKMQYRMWLQNDNAAIAPEFAGRPNYNAGGPAETNPNATENGENKLPAAVEENKWTKLTLTYKITQQNKKACNIRFDDYGSTTVAKDFFVAGFEVEKLAMPDGSVYIDKEPEIPIDTARYSVKVKGEEYKPVDSFLSSLLDVGQTYTLLLDNNNKIAGYISSVNEDNYGLLLDAARKESTLEKGIRVKILTTDGTVETYDTLESITAYNGSEIAKVKAESLITNEPIDITTSHYLWSTDNAKNFKGSTRTWFDDTTKSKAACRRVVYYKTNSDGVITSIIVPSAPEALEKSKIVFRNNSSAPMTYNTELKLVSIYNASKRTDFSYHLADDAVVFEANCMNYDLEDYRVLKNGVKDFAKDRWEYAQLYSFPKSENIDFVVSISTGPKVTSMGTVIVKGVGQGTDGYTLYGYYKGQEFERNIRPGTRLMENNWATTNSRDTGEFLTEKNAAENVGRLPVCLAYESNFMGNTDTPEVTPDTLNEGDIVRVAENEDGEIKYVEVVMRKDRGLIQTFTSYAANNGYMLYSGDEDIRCGRVGAVDSFGSMIKFTSYVWGGTETCVSSRLEGTDWQSRPISEVNLFTNPAFAASVTVYDFKTGKAYAGKKTDCDTGDYVVVVGSLKSPRELFILKNYSV